MKTVFKHKFILIFLALLVIIPTAVFYLSTLMSIKTSHFLITKVGYGFCGSSELAQRMIKEKNRFTDTCSLTILYDDGLILSDNKKINNTRISQKELVDLKSLIATMDFNNDDYLKKPILPSGPNAGFIDYAYTEYTFYSNANEMKIYGANIESSKQFLQKIDRLLDR